MAGTSMGRSLQIVEALLAVAAVLVGLFVASVLLGIQALGPVLPGGLEPWGEGRALVGVDDALLDTPVVLPEAPEWDDTSADGTRDKVTGLGPVEITGPYRAQVTLWSPTAGERAAYVVAKVAPSLVALAVLVVLLKLVRSARGGDPFTPVNVRRLRLLAVLVGVGGVLAGAGAEMLEAWMLDHSAAAAFTVKEAVLPLNAVLLGLLIAVLAEVWAHGVRLREDVEGLV